MGIFQTTVLNKYLKSLDKKALDISYNKFKAHFHNPVIQENIREGKEEQYQGEFLIDLFVNVLGYTKYPNPDYNLTTEYKNVKDAKKADGAIIINGAVIAVIELKGTETTDLGKIETQAFGYKNNQPDCVYIITSNFEKLRFYIDNATEHIEFNLFTLTEKEFEILYLCLAQSQIEKGTPKKLKEESLSQEDVITKQLYRDYSLFKKELHQSLVKLNPQYKPLDLFKKSQKLLDRFLFLFFAEDRQLLPPNSVRLILEQWQQLTDLDENVPLYDRFKKYFGYLNTGFKGKKFDVFAYNGGLFKEDEILDDIKIDNQLLYKHTLKLSEYDFASEVDVNILGHIFENSLNQLEEIKAEIEGEEIDRSKTKRKKDGVFYTPKYVTKFIVDNTIGNLCKDKKIELKINESDYVTDKKRQTATKKILLDRLNTYRSWLLGLTICDPACGSGAFLNQALEFLIAEHNYIDELLAKVHKASIAFTDIENSILENNLFGVDLNEESIEIAKLSLWLRTAQPNRKLNDLSGNIKCGNSLIENKKIEAKNAFNWKEAFPNVFDGGGFDIIIGNPPYVLCQQSNTKENILEFYKTYKVASYKIDLFHLFFERSINLMKPKGRLGFITPNTYLTNKFIQPLREFITHNTDIESLVIHEESVFVDAGVDVATIILRKNKIKDNKISIFKSDGVNLVQSETKSQKEWEDDSEVQFNVKDKFSINFRGCVPLGEIFNSYFGIQAFDRNSSISFTQPDDTFLEIIDGGDIYSYAYALPEKFFNYKPENIKSGGDWEVYSKERIVVRQIGQIPVVGICRANILTSNTLYNLYPKSLEYDIYYILSILNSKLLKKYWLSKFSDNKALFPKIKGYQLKELPIKIANREVQLKFVEYSKTMLSLNTELLDILNKFKRILIRKFPSVEPSKKLNEWHTLSFSEVVKELNKKKIKLSLSEEAEWEDYFLKESKIALELKSKIESTDKAIDSMIYKLYELTEAEIQIVEKG